jgi:hypothetical protein
MDFKSLINKIESIDGKIEAVAAPELPKAVQLNEDAELRVLAGTSSYISEAKKAKEEKKKESVEEGFDDTAKTGDTFKTKTGVATKTKTGVKHERTYEKEKDNEDDDTPEAKKAKKESVDPTAFKDKFAKMVEAKKAKPDFLDVDKDGDKKEPMKKAVADKKKGAVKESEEEKRAPAKKTEREVSLPSGAKGKITKVQGWQSQKAEKAAEKDSEKNESKMMPKGKKRPVKESVERKLTFKQMVQLVQESGGQQQIDPKDQELFAWASRVAKNKLGEGMKAELYAGLIYERNGGIFQMYDVLSESKKKLSENFSKVGEAAPNSNLAVRIQDAFGAIYDMGDDGLDYLNNHAPIYNQLFNKHRGDLDRIISRENPAVLRKLADELEEIADGASFDLESFQADKIATEDAGATADDVRQVLGQAGFSEEDVDGLLRFALSSGIPSDAGRNLKKMLKTLNSQGIDVFDIPPEGDEDEDDEENDPTTLRGASGWDWDDRSER